MSKAGQSDRWTRYSNAAKGDKAAEDEKVTGKRYDRLFMRHWDHWLDELRSQLFAIALDEDGIAGDDIVRLSKLDADVPSRVWGGNEEYAITPDGKTVYFAARLRNRDEPTFVYYPMALPHRPFEPHPY